MRFTKINFFLHMTWDENKPCTRIKAYLISCRYFVIRSNLDAAEECQGFKLSDSEPAWQDQRHRDIKDETNPSLWFCKQKWKSYIIPADSIKETLILSLSLSSCWLGNIWDNDHYPETGLRWRLLKKIWHSWCYTVTQKNGHQGRRGTQQPNVEFFMGVF